MRQIILLLIILVLPPIGLAGPQDIYVLAAPQDIFNEGIAAYEKRDYKNAFTKFEQAAAQDLPNAQYLLGLMYVNGTGVKQDYQEAVKWYLKSAEQGFFGAQTNLGTMYKDGIGVKQNYQEAVKWWGKAAEQGVDAAQYNLGNAYRNGNGVKQDYHEAVKWYRKAAEQGNSAAQINLGIMYESGTGVKQNKAVAKEWYGKACNNGEQRGCDIYKELNEAGIAQNPTTDNSDLNFAKEECKAHHPDREKDFSSRTRYVNCVEVVIMQRERSRKELEYSNKYR